MIYLFDAPTPHLRYFHSLSAKGNSNPDLSLVCGFAIS